MKQLNHSIECRLALAVLLCFSASLFAGPHTVTKNQACPDAWALTDKVIPVVYPTSDPWGEPINGVDDKALAKAHITSVKPIETLAAQPVTDDDLVNDPLTVASACLTYRNLEVDTANSVTPPAPSPNPATGWVPAAIF